MRERRKSVWVTFDLVVVVVEEVEEEEEGAH